MTHPIIPPPELVQQWASEWMRSEAAFPVCRVSRDNFIAACTAQWVADKELEACFEWLEQNVERWEIPLELRNARRPKPSSLKEQARSELIDAYNAGQIDDSTYDTIRRAIEALPDG